MREGGAGGRETNRLWICGKGREVDLKEGSIPEHLVDVVAHR